MLGRQFLKKLFAAARAHSAVEGDGLAVNKSAILAGEKVNQCRDFLGLADPAEWNQHPFSINEVLAAGRVCHWSIHGCWADAINPDVLGREFECRGLCQSNDCML